MHDGQPFDLRGLLAARERFDQIVAREVRVRSDLSRTKISPNDGFVSSCRGAGQLIRHLRAELVEQTSGLTAEGLEARFVPRRDRTAFPRARRLDWGDAWDG